ncbi:hypothetical protein SAMN05443572_101827 [Myxococcus fulvus]|uniref:Uncharacterized protein n=1 Tax=Myxococcus fulvus TaxID=33 RepID=A0A511SVQ3_MYXFU|nr:hypothetical protein [Myxococcus fulvus]GEN05627.1 hypothetical protein MFU01_06640 [Myxococcus fulvus]SET00875.1 hypothetical protein SAMN05443572_101827 [Myxococcus fulvus]
MSALTSSDPPLLRSSADRELALTCGLIVAAVAAGAYHCGYLATPVVDDAAISIAYGHSFFEGAGWRVTPHSQPVEGFSNPLWTLLLGLSRPLGFAPEPYAHTLGIILGLLALPLFALWGPISARRLPRLEDVAAPWVAATSPTYLTWISSGMETGLQSLLLATAGVLLLRELRTGRGASVGLALALLCLTRPEGVLYVVGAGLLWLAHQALERRWAGRQALGIACWVLALVGGWYVVRWAYFADLFPNTYYAKRFWELDGSRYVKDYLAIILPLAWLALVGIVLGGLGGVASARSAALGALFLAAGGFFAWRSGDWMREWRFLAPLVPLLGVCMAAGMSGVRARATALASRGGHWRWPARIGVAAVGVTVLWVAVPALRAATLRSPRIKAAPELPFQYVASHYVGVKRRAAELGQLRPLVAAPDLGGQAMVLRDAELMDVAGLGDRAIAYHSGNAPALADYLLSEGPPFLLDAHGPSHYLSKLPDVMPRFRHIGGTEWQLIGLSATEDPRCPGGKSAALAPDREALTHLLEQDIQEGDAERGLKRWRCVLTYKPGSQLPTDEARERLADLATERAEALEDEGQRLPALRLYSLATLLDEGDAHRRRKTELLRAQVFPPPPSSG